MSRDKGRRVSAKSLLDFRYLVGISIVLFSVIIGVALLIVYRNAQVMRDRINADFNQQQLILARQAASQIDANLTDIATELASLSGVIQQGPAAANAAAMTAVFQRTQGKGVILLGLTDAAGRVFEVYPSPAPASLSIPGDCRFTDSGRMVLGPLRAEERSPGQMMVTGYFCTQLKAGNVLFAKVAVSQLVAGVTAKIRSGKTGYAWVIDEQGLFLDHPEREFIGRNAFTARKLRKPYISFTQINQIMKDRMLRGEEGAGIYVSGWHRGIEGEITKLIAFTPLRSAALEPGQAWSVAVVAPISEVAGAVHEVYVRQFEAQAALIAGMFVFGLLVAIYQHRLSQTLSERVKRTEADLHETERIYQRVVEQATDLIYILDLEMRVVLLNRHSLETFSHLVLTRSRGGVLPDDADLTQANLLLGRQLPELFGAADVAFMRKQMERVLERKQSQSYEHTLNIEGRKIYLSTKLIPIRDDAGRIYQLLGISRDVTEKMELEQRIYNTEKLASIGTLAAGVAHEINNPLGIMLGFTDLLLDRFPPGSPAYEDLKIIEHNANHAKKVVEDLLGFARITEGLEDTVDVRQSIETVTGIIRNTLMTKKIELALAVPEGLPRVRGDAREFQQVIFNLINNAVAAMAETGGGTLTIAAWTEDGWVNVKVADTGVGIPDKIKPRIFDPFFTTKKVGEGTGLGLSLCYGIVKKYGGKISFVSLAREDRPDQPSGTAFTVSMPVRQDEDQERRESA